MNKLDMPRPFHAVLEWIAIVVVVVAVTDIAAPPHVATRALDESAFWVSIAVVAAAKVGCSGDLDDAPTYIADLSGCGGSSQLEAYVQERNERDHRHIEYGGLWQIGMPEARHRVQGTVAAAGCDALSERHYVQGAAAAAGSGASMRWWHSIVSELTSYFPSLF